MSPTLTSRQRFLAACRRERVDRTPAWIMRQAGRYLPEYREVRGQHDFMTMVRTSELAAEVTCQPLRRFDMDAAVIFSDILVPCEAMGVKVSFAEGEGPALEPHVRTRADIEALRNFDPSVATGFLGDAIRRVRREFGTEKAIIGFCGAPWTTASYMIEGATSRNFEASKRLLYADPVAFARLCERLVDNLIPYLGMQIEAGADVVQIFDSWGGAFDAATYRAALLPHVQRLIEGVRRWKAPVILYVNGCAQLLDVLADSGADVLGIDWRVTPELAIERVGKRVALQGNLDPCVLFAPPPIVEEHVSRTLAAFEKQTGHIFNLGSGILPGTPVESVEAVFRVLRRSSPGAKRAPTSGQPAFDEPPDLLGRAERERLRRLLGGADAANALPADDIEDLLERLNEIRTRRLERPEFRVGQRVRVKQGPWTGEIGRVTRLDGELPTLRVELVQSGRGTEFEFHWWQLEIT